MKVMMQNFDKGEKKSYRALALKVIHYFDGKEVVRRDDLLHGVTALNPIYTEDMVDDCIKKLHAQKLIKVTKGRYSDVIIR